MTTPTTRYALNKIVLGSDNVDVVVDFNNNWDAIDLKLGTQVCTSSTRPASPVQGQLIYETDTTLTRVYKGATWQTAGVGVCTSSARPANPIQGDIIYETDTFVTRVYSGSAWRTVGNSTSLSSALPANPIQGDFTYCTDNGGEAYYSGSAWHFSSLIVATSVARPTGSALQTGTLIYETDTHRLMVYNGTSAAWENKSGAFVCTSTTRPSTPGQGHLIYETDTNRTLLYNGTSWMVLAGVINAVTSTTTIANTAALAALQTGTVPANEPIAGSIYEMYGSGMYSVTGTPTLQFTLYWGGIAGTNLITFSTFTTTSGITNANFDYHVRLNFRSTTSVVATMTTSINTNAASNSSNTYTQTSAPTTVTTSSASALAVGFQWGTASASNTASLLGGYLEQIA